VGAWARKAPTVFDNYNGKYKDHMPQVKTDSSGIDAWEFNGRRMPNLGLNAVVGRRPEEYGVEPCAFSQLRKGCYDVHARVDDMSANGVLGSLNFPQFVNNGLALRCDDQKLSLAAVKAYNDWHIDEWAGAYPGRFIPTVTTVRGRTRTLATCCQATCSNATSLPVSYRIV